MSEERQVARAEATEATKATAWSLPKRVAFRLVAVFLVMFAIVGGNDAAPPLSLLGHDNPVQRGYVATLDAIAIRLGHLLKMSGDVSAADNGSGDRLGNYLLLLFAAAVAVGVTVVWSLKSRKLEHRRELAIARALFRYFVAATMLTYGFMKVFPVQFPLPWPTRLVEPYGDSSPMGLLWTFMGASPAYTVFAGMSEVLGAALLLFRRTTTLGALVLTAVLTNVVMLNLCYDVCVKLGSLQLLGATLFILAPSIGRLGDVFVRHRAVAPEIFAAPGGPRWLVRGRPFAKACVVLGLVALAAVPAAREYYRAGDGAPRPALYGAFEIEELWRDGVVAEPLFTDGAYWRQLVFIRGYGVVDRVDGRRAVFRLDFDDAAGRGKLSRTTDGATLSVVRDRDGHVAIEGKLEGVAYKARAHPVDPRHELLLRRGFRWVSDTPFNR